LSHLFNNARVIYLPKAKAGAREQPITKHWLWLRGMRIKTVSIFRAQWINWKKGTGSLRNRSEIFSDTITQELHKTKAAFMFFM